jgi:small subunit ribosomal protein S8
MSMTDPIADLLTRIRNALRSRKEKVDVPHSVLKEGVVDVLLREGFVNEKQVLELDAIRKVMRIRLKYGVDGEKVVTHIQRVSRPGRRIYSGSAGLPRVQGGLGISVVSTSQGVLSDREARAKKVGGEILAEVW